MNTGPDPRLDALRAISRSAWVEEATQELRRPRRDWKGPRHPVMVRLPQQLADDLADLAGAAGLSLSETVGVMVWAYLRRSGRRVTS
jgi:hypothetical protein